MRFRLLLLALTALGCGSTGAPAPVVGEPFTEKRSFNVTATFIPAPGSTFASNMPRSAGLTLVLDPSGAYAIAGGGGQARVVPLVIGGNPVFRIATKFDVGISQAACSGLVGLQYQTVDVTVDGDQLTGHARGLFSFASPDGAPATDPFEAKLEGARDTTPPFLVVPPGADTTDPIASYQLWTSEPLPASALARLVGGDGAVAGLVPEVLDTDIPLIASFARPTVTLPPGQTYNALFSDDVVDLAGNVAPMGEALRLAAAAPAPLVPPDGFESAEQSLGGAVIATMGPGVPIAGARSLFLGHTGSPHLGPGTPTPKLVVRMAVPPGATKLRFSYVEVSLENKAATGLVQLGSVGRAPGEVTPIPAPTTWDQVPWGGGRTIGQSPLQTMEVPLPDATGPEIVVVLSAGPTPCLFGPGTPGLVIDDLRID